MSVRLLFGLVVSSVLVWAADPPDDATMRLARVLAAKGAISATELSSIETAPEQQRVTALASLLEQKGMLTAAEAAQILPPAANRPVLAQQSPQSAVPAAGPRTAPAPAATSETHLPITFYGTLLVNAAYNDVSTNIEDLPLLANKQGSDPTGGDKNYAMTARQTRLGLRFQQSNVAGADLTGQFEFDLFAGKTPLANGINMDIFRLRLAYGKMQWKHLALEAGQDWSIFAPLNPTSYAAFAIPEFSASGNPWIRLPQFRMELGHDIGASHHVLWQVSAADPDMGDYQTTTFSTSRTPGIGERGRMPSIESRVALTHKVDDRDFTVGFSGHYGRGKNFGTIGTLNVQSPVDSWGAAVDFSLPITRHFALSGEAFEGRALGIYSVASGEAIGAVGTPGSHGILSRGGWAQAEFNFARQWQVNLAYGLDVPDVSELPVGNRGRNQTYMGNLIYKLSRNVLVAWEYRRLLTDYRNQPFGNERGDHVNMAVGYTF